jgi:hypothetical protein
VKPTLCGALLLLTVIHVVPAQAALGENQSSVQVDQAKFQASVTLTTLPSYRTYELTTPWGTSVREYVDNNDNVFGVGWNGPSIPDLQTALGAYFSRYLAASAAQHNRGPFLMNDGTLAVYSGGQLRAFAGHAYLPTAVPVGIDPNDIR